MEHRLGPAQPREPGQDRRMGVLQRVEDGDLVAEREQFDDGMAADVAGASGDQDADGWILRDSGAAGLRRIIRPQCASARCGSEVTNA
ncbi:MAG: hypothetical protein U5R48_07225 [Gammaproteobacteria bacterium]|nr:hypothetical protein [Gammaproteobacteria bacterium]